MKRAASALINAQLIPLINEFLDAVKANLIKRNIKAPMVIVRGDGTLMSEEFARKMPVETLLSGPAASVIGTMHLAEIKDATIIDIGGTTSDIASVKDGRVGIREDGAIVGAWRTHVMAADIFTHGIGGDSKLRIDGTGNITFGPDKTTPISLLLNNERSDGKILEKVEQVIGVDSNVEGGFTPTDLAHVIGIYDKWNYKAADAAIKVLQDRLKCDRETCIEKIENAFFNTIKKALDDSQKMKDNISVIAIGAPSHAWMPKIAARYGFTSYVPENAEVANAIGAAVGRIEEKFEVIIRQDKSHGQYMGFLNIRREEFSSLEEAKTVCISEAKRIVEERVKEANCSDYEILEEVEDVYCDTYGGGESIYIETKIRVMAVGDPECICTKTK
jgi:N-methylhydantoinase A/oxoprolinase/acetone carboxylase beta subunit